MDFRKYLEKIAADLDREMEKILEEQLKKAEKTDRKLIPLLKAFTKSCQGGKRIRGALVVLGYEIGRQVTGNKLQVRDKEIVKIGAAYEIMHNAILVHDDIIDQSTMRRGKPSLYQALGGNHYGISQAISLADYGFFLAFKIISETNFSSQSKNKALQLFSGVTTDTAWGEMLDLEETDRWVVMKMKTARYTISGPLQIGAVLAGANGRLLEQLGLFGEKLGIAFQIQDDILDFEVDYLKGTENAEKEARKYQKAALEILPKLTNDSKLSKILEQMGECLVERSK